MVIINGKEFNERPGMCCTCPFYSDGSSSLAYFAIGFCTLFEENHRGTINPPPRCRKLFNKAFRFPDGSKLQIVIND